MNPEYVIVQAGGKGTRMEYLTANKPKALVPIGNRPMLFHLFEKYPDKKFVIIADYKSDVMKKYLEAFAKVKYIVIETHGKKGTCSGIQGALEKIPENTEFMLIWSDLVLPSDFEFPKEVDDYVGLSKNFRCRWSYKDDLFEEIPSEDFGVAGVFLFKDKNKLRNVPVEGELVRWMQQQGERYNTFGLYRTKEYGLLSEWNKLGTRKEGGQCRPFNKMTVEGDVITKEGIDEQGRSLAVREKAWYKFVMDKGYQQIPRIYAYEPFQMQRIHGKNIFQYELSYDEQKKVIDKLVDCLKKLHTFGETSTDYFSIYEAYLGKTFNRLNKIRDLVPFANDKIITINGRKCRNVFFYKDELIKKFENYQCDKFVFLHGDNTFSNMMLDENMNPVLIDPRGYFGYTEMYGDVAYDWAKLYYSIVGNYDQFNLKRFQLTIKEDSVQLDIESNNWEQVEDYYMDLIKDDVDRNTIKLIHAIIWLSLTTYAWEDYDSICGAFYNGLYYLEEVL